MQQIIVAGSGRSGTTWIGDVLSSCLRCCSGYEPLRAAMVPEVPTNGQPGEHPATYLRAAEENPEWGVFFHDLFAGDISNCWTRQDWNKKDGGAARLIPPRFRPRVAAMRERWKRRAAEHCVIKEIRANLLIGWLSRRFGVRVVYLTRHPCAVVGSRLRLKWNDVLEEVISQPHLAEDFLGPFKLVLQSARTPLQRMAAHWCVENLVPLRQLASNPQWITVSYEECLAGPEALFAKLFEKLRLTPSGTTAGKMRTLVSVPSAGAGTSRPWHHPLSESEGNEVIEMCRSFGISLYGREPGPLCRPREAISSTSRTAMRMEA